MSKLILRIVFYLIVINVMIVKKNYSFAKILSITKLYKNKKMFNFDSEYITHFLIASFKKHRIKNCLTSALISYRIFMLSGIMAKLYIGYNKSNGELISHAWVEADNYIIHTNRQNISELTVIFDI